MSHTTTILERIIERRRREETTIEDKHVGVMPGIKGRPMQYSRCGNLWRNIGENRKDCIWFFMVFIYLKGIR